MDNTDVSVTLKVQTDSATVRALTQNLEGLQKMFELLTSTGVKASSELVRANAALSAQATESQRLSNELSTLRQRHDAVAATSQKVSDRLQQTRNSLAANRTETKNLAAEVERLRGHLASAVTGLTRMGEAAKTGTPPLLNLNQANKQTGQSANSMAAAYNGFRLIVGGIVVGTIKNMAGALLDADMEMARVRTTLIAVTGSSAAANLELDFIRNTAQRLGADLPSLAQGYSKFSAAVSTSGVSAEETRRIFVAFTEAGTAMGLPAHEMTGIFNALGQMFSKGNVQAEELRGQLGERLPGAFNLAAQAMGMTTVELNKALDMGQVLASDMVPRLASVVQAKFGGSLPEAMDGTRAGINRLNTAWFDLKATFADAGFAEAARTIFTEIAAGLNLVKSTITETQTTLRVFWALLASGGNPTKMAGMLSSGAGAAAGGAAPAAGSFAPSAAEKTQKAAVAELMGRAGKLTETQEKYRDAVIASKREQEQIVMLEQRMVEIRAEQAKAVSLNGLSPAEQAKAVAGSTQKQVELEIELLEITKKIESARERIRREDEKAENENKRKIAEVFAQGDKLHQEELKKARAQIDAAKSVLEVKQQNLQRELAMIDGDFGRTEAEKFADRKRILQESVVVAQQYLQTVTAIRNSAPSELGDSNVRAAGNDVANAQGAVAGLGPDPNSFGQSLEAQMTQMREGFLTTAEAITDVMGSAIDGIAGSITGLINQTMTWGDALRNIGGSILNGVISSFARMFAQWIVGRLLMSNVAQAASVKEGAVDAAAKAPGALLTSISSWGVAAALGVAALVAAMASFDTGGFTSQGETMKPAGIVHSGEWVAPKWMLQDSNYRGVINGLESARTGSGSGLDNFMVSGGSSPLSSGIVSGGGAGGGSPAVASGGGMNIAYFNTRQDAQTWLESQDGRRVMMDFIRQNQYDL